MIFLKEQFLEEAFMAQRYLCFKAFFYFVINIDTLPSDRCNMLFSHQGLVCSLPLKQLLGTAAPTGFSPSSLLQPHFPLVRSFSSLFAHVCTYPFSKHLWVPTRGSRRLWRFRGHLEPALERAHLNLNPSSALQLPPHQEQYYNNTSIASLCEIIKDFNHVKHFR